MMPPWFVRSMTASEFSNCRERLAFNFCGSAARAESSNSAYANVAGCRTAVHVGLRRGEKVRGFRARVAGRQAAGRGPGDFFGPSRRHTARSFPDRSSTESIELPRPLRRAITLSMSARGRKPDGSSRARSAKTPKRSSTRSPIATGDRRPNWPPSCTAAPTRPTSTFSLDQSRQPAKRAQSWSDLRAGRQMSDCYSLSSLINWPRSFARMKIVNGIRH